MHYDLTENDVYLGKLYVFEVKELSLLEKGISKQWFLTHQKAGAVVSGYVNEDNQWSISPPFSLEPTQNYEEKEQLFGKVFGKDYIDKLKSLVNSKSDDEDTTTTETEKTQIDTPILTETVQSKLAIIMPELIEEEQETKTSEEVTQTTTTTNNLTTLEANRKQLEEALALLLIKAHHEEDLENLDSLWQVADKNGIKYLVSREDSHIVLAVNPSGEVIESLSLEDALIAVNKFTSEKEEETSIDMALDNLASELPLVSTEKTKTPSELELS